MTTVTAHKIRTSVVQQKVRHELIIGCHWLDLGVDLGVYFGGSWLQESDLNTTRGRQENVGDGGATSTNGCAAASGTITDCRIHFARSAGVPGRSRRSRVTRSQCLPREVVESHIDPLSVSSLDQPWPVGCTTPSQLSDLARQQSSANITMEIPRRWERPDVDDRLARSSRRTTGRRADHCSSHNRAPARCHGNRATNAIWRMTELIESKGISLDHRPFYSPVYTRARYITWPQRSHSLLAGWKMFGALCFGQIHIRLKMRLKLVFIPFANN